MLVLSAVSTKTSWLENVAQLIFLLFVFILVLGLAYLAARIAGSYQSNVIQKRSNIRVIETYRISNNKWIQIVRIGDKYAALGIGKDTVTLLMELDEDSIHDFSANTMQNASFKEIFDKIKHVKKNEKQDEE